VIAKALKENQLNPLSRFHFGGGGSIERIDVGGNPMMTENEAALVDRSALVPSILDME
jgi:hypothetical protein